MADRQHIRYDEIVRIVEPGSKVLDLGCGDGELLLRLRNEKGIIGRGVEIEEEMILQCISKGISVFQGNLDEGLKDYGTKSYDYVILNQTLQVIRMPLMIIDEMLRVGRRAIVSFPNFGYVVTRLQLLTSGRMPVNRELPYQWYDTPNIHLCTRRDFLVLCRELGISILQEVALQNERRVSGPWKNVLATEVCFVLERAAAARSDAGAGL